MASNDAEESLRLVLESDDSQHTRDATSESTTGLPLSFGDLATDNVVEVIPRKKAYGSAVELQFTSLDEVTPAEAPQTNAKPVSKTKRSKKIRKPSLETSVEVNGQLINMASFPCIMCPLKTIRVNRKLKRIAPKFGGRGKLKDHMDNVHKELRPLLVCDTCQSIFETPAGAKTHMLTPCAYDDSLDDSDADEEDKDDANDNNEKAPVDADAAKDNNETVSVDADAAKSPPIAEEVRDDGTEPKVASNVDSVDKDASAPEFESFDSPVSLTTIGERNHQSRNSLDSVVSDNPQSDAEVADAGSTEDKGVRTMRTKKSMSYFAYGMTRAGVKESAGDDPQGTPILTRKVGIQKSTTPEQDHIELSQSPNNCLSSSPEVVPAKIVNAQDGFTETNAKEYAAKITASADESIDRSSNDDTGDVDDGVASPGSAKRQRSPVKDVDDVKPLSEINGNGSKKAKSVKKGTKIKTKKTTIITTEKMSPDCVTNAQCDGEADESYSKDAKSSPQGGSSNKSSNTGLPTAKEKSVQSTLDKFLVKKKPTAVVTDQHE